ncbi:hypothetical protein LVD15_24405 [Fulvivirga maritima]|uniref:hypothetical protein n=1 Tax=Fulvivirga maritima TaxID=2904247 RepID=UPI001F4876B2|nr:hypothetical protein [Fulvivirga maritima]UII26402.1 hypothetical protein LVD15_24405 [Fulvivirga maritima]
MKRYKALILLLLIVLFSACGEDDDLQTNNETGQKVKHVNHLIYTVFGDNQIGRPGEFLDKGIQLGVRRYNGKRSIRPYSFSLDDTTGYIELCPPGVLIDSVSIYWKLGVRDEVQYLTITDELSCDENGNCKSQPIFRIKATAVKP